MSEGYGELASNLGHTGYTLTITPFGVLEWSVRSSILDKEVTVKQMADEMFEDMAEDKLRYYHWTESYLLGGTIV